ncbi:hypothetical protein FAVG1_01336 [Fusarium avenaceum]|nr:hypothetical protein FAVG1_01336 [Fusarium avenaceum]
MNWTEGALSRHSRGKGWDKDAARQRQYFAKARARKHAPASSKGLDVTSFVPDYISQPKPSQERQSTTSTSSRKQRTPRRGLVYKQPEVVKKSDNHSPKDTSTQLGKRSAEDEQTSNMPVDKDHKDLNTTEKRRRLLEKADWTGVITQKPALVDFSWRKNPPTKPTTKPISTHDHRSNLPSRRSLQRDYPNEGTLGRISGNEMKINIGNQNLRWSRDSNSVRSLSTRHGLIPYGSNHYESQGIMSPYQQHAHSVDVSEEHSTVLPHPCEPQANIESQNPRLKFPADNHNLLRRHVEYEENRQRESDEPRYVVRANTPVIHQPQPKRDTRPLMFDIRSPEPQEDISTVGVLGTSTKSSSRVTSEDIRWNTWLSSNTEPKLQQPAPMTHENQLSRSISPGISQHWNTFVFDDDSIETSRKARQEAHEQTKRDLGLEKPNIPFPFFESTLSSSSVAPPSDVAEPPSASRDGRSLHKDNNHSKTDDRAEDLRKPSEAVANTSIESTTDSFIAHPASPQPLLAEFKFHQPQLFTGRLANDAPCNPPSTLYAQPKKGRRSRKRRDKERPDFRAVPNYNDDPIEED